MQENTVKKHKITGKDEIYKKIIWYISDTPASENFIFYSIFLQWLWNNAINL